MSLSTSVQRVALVTGSGKKRVGWHVADALAGRGYNIAVHYRNSAKEAAETVEHLRNRGVEAVAFQADLAEESAVRDLVRGTQDYFTAPLSTRQRGWRKIQRRTCATILRPIYSARSFARSRLA